MISTSTINLNLYDVCRYEVFCLVFDNFLDGLRDALLLCVAAVLKTAHLA
jgi:hypothetical protein